MFRTDGGPQRFELPGSEPKTVVLYRTLSQEDDLVLTAQIERVKRGDAMVGREADDPQTMRKLAQTERAILGGLIVSVENMNEPGDRVTDAEQIEAFLKALPAVWFYRLKAEMSSGLSLFEGKA